MVDYRDILEAAEHGRKLAMEWVSTTRRYVVAQLGADYQDSGQLVAAAIVFAILAYERVYGPAIRQAVLLGLEKSELMVARDEHIEGRANRMEARLAELKKH